MAKKSSSKRWLERQARDPYVRQAQQAGWRSRAVYKLMEIQERDRLLRPGWTIVDLGAAPGGWSQYAASVIGDGGRILAVDLLPMDAIPGVECIRGDFTSEDTLMKMLQSVAEGTADLVMSDMAPNISGNRSIDQPRSMYLAELALDAATRFLRPRGAFVTKLFHGEGFDQYVRDTRRRFDRVKVRKPDASRSGSRETYLVATNYRV